MVIAVIVAILASCALCFRQVSNQIYILNLIGCRLIVLLVEKKIRGKIMNLIGIYVILRE